MPIYASLAKLKVLGIVSNIAHPNMKGQLYKTYLRPILFYGLENHNLGSTEKLKIKRIEGNRLIRNTYTREILRIFETIEVNQSFISEIDEFKSLVGDDSSLERSEVCSVYKYIVKTDLRASKEDHIVLKIREIFCHMNGEEMLFEFTRFDRQN
ncbi:hypothetical protein BpHYR1_038620 [Brachionus plicatilis]|uniref:Uncharacterized protein n=1 Tax=Brachionus plicatilis TaxID=10195 RepID=A0A3M7PZ65_BRAPC|nr:hypothetical protein BpHYR1_038620 [Brachionus plicatilis]